MPKIVRFLSEDTYKGNTSDPLSLNLYTYYSNEPLMYADPDGHAQQLNALQNVLIKKFQTVYAVAAKAGDKKRMRTAHGGGVIRQAGTPAN